MTGMDAGSPSSGMRRRAGMRRRTGGRADVRTDTGRSGVQTRGQAGSGRSNASARGDGAPDTAPAHGGAHGAPGTDGQRGDARERAGRTCPRPVPATGRPPGRGVGPRSHAGPLHRHRGRHPNGPAADTHRPGAGSRPAAEGGCAAADSGIPAAARPAAPGTGGRRAPGHDRRLPRLPAMTLHQPSDRQGASSAPGLPALGPGVNRGADALLPADNRAGPVCRESIGPLPVIVGESRPPTGRCLCVTGSAASRMSGVELPPVLCPFESAIRPRVRPVERRAVEWVRDSGMCAS